jgi:oxygen-independent coproporphyrinogen-3 oxidase
MHPRHVYVHVPFCARRCSYCDFSIAVRRVVPAAAFADAVGREIDLRFPATGEPWRAETLYFGGGTPSRLGADGVARLMDTVRARVTLEPGAEVTLEANPEDVTPDAARAWRDGGITRVSLGAQSFDDRVLAWMHRVHDADGTRAAFHALRDAGFDDLSLDLIFSVPDALERDWTRDLHAVLELAPEHLSLYGLTIEPHTPLGRWAARAEVVEAPEDRYADEFLRAHREATAAGFVHYEVSNFGRGAARGRHNSAYWRGVPYAGLGPSAHEFDGATRRWNVAPYAEWLREVQAGVDPMEDDELLNPSESATEGVYLGLRTTEGLELRPPEWTTAEPWIAANWAERRDDRLALTPSGWLRMDGIALTLIGSRL